jgi:peptidoglycan/xylan/chitin deacetylase (PgdA/CDA1 family)
VYHRVAPAIAGLPTPSINVTPPRFASQLTGLRDRGFRVISLKTLLAWHRSNVPITPRTVVVTFDDGFESVHRWAFPVLRELSMPATIFVSTAYLDSHDPFPFDPWGLAYRTLAQPLCYRPLTSEQCHEMADSGLIELGAHTHTHRDFRGHADEFRLDLKTCVDVLRAKFGATDVTFAFPFGRRHSGHSGDALIAAARRSGVTCALSTEAVLVNPSADPFTWGRFNVYDWDTSATLEAKLEGWYSWAPRLQERLFHSSPAGA